MPTITLISCSHQPSMPHVLLNSMVGWVGEAVQTQRPVAFPSAARSIA